VEEEKIDEHASCGDEVEIQFSAYALGEDLRLA